jgi:glycosyltransferase involved in cell wall biosynthesis
MPFFSIILPTYNRAHFLPKAIESVLAQTFEDWELVIVDDGSTDNTKEVVLAYQDLRIVYIYQENQERSAARNNGISQAKGDFICFLDSDDYYLPEKLMNLSKQIKIEDKLVLYFDGIVTEIRGELIQNPFQSIKNENWPEFILTNTLFSQQICGKKEIFKQFKFNSKIRIGEDMELWMRISASYNLEQIKNSFQTVIVEHENRSVNLKHTKVATDQLNIIKSIINNSIGIKSSIKRKVISNYTFNVAKYFMLNNKIFPALYWVFKSIILDVSNDQLKHRIYTLINLLTMKIPQEYKRL